MIPAPLKNADCLFLAKENHAKTGSAYLAAIKPEQLPALAKAFYAAGYHLEDVSGLVVSEGAVSAYHFDHFDAPGRCTILAIAPHGAASFPSIADVYQGAEWHEREARDFYGFDYPGNPNLIPLLMPETMPDVHPLQKEEGARASLASLFSAPGREREIVSKADGFTMLDVPAAEEPAEKPGQEAPKQETPTAETAPEKPVAKAAEKAEPKPEPKAEQPEKAEAKAQKPAEKAAPKAEAKKPAAPKAAPKAQGKAVKAAPKKPTAKGGDNA